jgi:dolichol-phosphate mannosyltransferase
MQKLSVIIPAYNESKNISVIIDKFKSVFLNFDSLEIIFIDDGSKDNTWEVLSQTVKDNKNIKAIKFSRNFGKEAAIFAGLKEAVGQACIVMDCDLQHPVETAFEMYNIWLNNEVDIVEAKKNSRGEESFLNKVFAKLFYSFFKSMSDIDMQGASDFKLMDRKVVDELNLLPERYTFFRALSSWVGFKTQIINFDVAPRNDGQTKWSFVKLFRYAINSIASFSSAPMQIVTGVGIVFLIFSIILGIQTIVNFIMGKSLGGFTTVILILLFTGSIIMLSLGVIGFYLSKIYDEIKQRPRYIISKKLGGENSD